MSDIVRVDIVDIDYEDYEDRIAYTFYLENPDRSKLAALINAVKNRFDYWEQLAEGSIKESDVPEVVLNMMGMGNYAIADYVEENFSTISIELMEMKF